MARNEKSHRSADTAFKGNFRESPPVQLEPADVFLVCMPYADTQIPSLALGLLQSVLIENAISAQSVYANLYFCERIGVKLYRKHNSLGHRLPVSEWSFATCAFPDFEPNQNYFIRTIHAHIQGSTQQSLEEVRSELLFVRQQAEEFTAALAKQIISLSPRIVGCSSTLQQRVPSLALLKKIHELDPEIITLMGGADCERIMGRTAHQHFSWLDYVVSGEAEDLLVPLVNRIFESGRDVPLESVPKGVYAPRHRRSGYRQLPNNYENCFRAVSESFSQQTIPYYHDYFDTLSVLPNMGKMVRPSLPIQSSRGCWYGKCKFCGLNNLHITYRSRPATNVLAELDELYRTYSVRRFEFLDTVLDTAYFQSLIPELIRKKAFYKIFYEVRAHMPKQYFAMLRYGGMYLCLIGIESLHTKALQSMRKGVAAWQNIQALKWCRQFGIYVLWNILYDFPGDQDAWCQEMAEIIPLLTHLCPPRSIQWVNFQRNSHYFEHAKKYSLELRPFPLLSEVYPLDPDAIRDLSCILEDEFYTAIRENKTLAALFPRSGLQNLKEAILQWFKNAFSQDPPVLSMREDSNTLVIKDTRPIAIAPCFCLTGVQKEIYLSCDQAQKESELQQMLQDKGFEQKDIDIAIQKLLENKLLIRIDSRLLALAVDEPYLEYVSHDESPLGWVFEEDIFDSA